MTQFKNLFQNVVDVWIPAGGSRKGNYIRILAEIDLSKPLLRGTKLRFQNQTVWVAFKYERMASFCFYCGMVGHLEKSCSARIGDVKDGNLLSGQFGDWLKADTFKTGSPASNSTAAALNLQTDTDASTPKSPATVPVPIINSPDLPHPTLSSLNTPSPLLNSFLPLSDPPPPIPMITESTDHILSEGLQTLSTTSTFSLLTQCTTVTALPSPILPPPATPHIPLPPDNITVHLPAPAPEPWPTLTASPTPSPTLVNIPVMQTDSTLLPKNSGRQPLRALDPPQLRLSRTGGKWMRRKGKENVGPLLT